MMEDVRHNEAGRTIRVGHGESSYRTFVPNPLPPRLGFPIIADMDFGHTSPQFTLPIGCVAEIDVQERRFEIVESAVEE